jgi:hypothetical protein
MNVINLNFSQSNKRLRRINKRSLEIAGFLTVMTRDGKNLQVFLYSENIRHFLFQGGGGIFSVLTFY